MPERLVGLIDWIREHWEWLAGSGVAGTIAETARRWWRRRQVLKSAGGVDPEVAEAQARARKILEEADLSNVKALEAGLRALHDTIEAQAADSGRLRARIAVLEESEERCRRLERGHAALARDHARLRQNIVEVCAELRRNGCTKVDEIQQRVMEGLDEGGPT